MTEEEIDIAAKNMADAFARVMTVREGYWDEHVDAPDGKYYKYHWLVRQLLRLIHGDKKLSSPT